MASVIESVEHELKLVPAAFWVLLDNVHHDITNINESKYKQKQILTQNPHLPCSRLGHLILCRDCWVEFKIKIAGIKTVGALIPHFCTSSTHEVYLKYYQHNFFDIIIKTYKVRPKNVFFNSGPNFTNSGPQISPILVQIIPILVQILPILVQILPNSGPKKKSKIPNSDFP